MRSFLRTKTGSRMGILGILNFIVLFFAPLLHGFVGTAIFTLNPIVLLVGYLVLVIAGILISAKSHNPLISFLGCLCCPFRFVGQFNLFYLF